MTCAKKSSISCKANSEENESINSSENPCSAQMHPAVPGVALKICVSSLQM